MTSKDLVPVSLDATGELKACQDALAEIEIHIYEAWTFETITKDAARHFLVIAEICGWDMPWIEEMRRWSRERRS